MQKKIAKLETSKESSRRKGRVSVLKKLRQKQAEIAKRSGKPIKQMVVAEDMERRRK